MQPTQVVKVANTLVVQPTQAVKVANTLVVQYRATYTSC